MVELFVSVKLVTLLSLVVIFLLEATLINVCFGKGHSNQLFCVESEKQALLSLKRDLVDPLDRLSSWDVQKDCCEWEGIVCHNKTGHVTELRLGDGSFKGKINPSLLSLEHLSHLDLSYNDFVGTQIPSFIGSLVGLQYLDLAESGFEGLIPHQLGNLSSLRHLDLGGSLGMYSRNLWWLSGLSSLEYLSMHYVNLSEASDHWLQVINKLSSLSELHLLSCELSHIHSPKYVNFTSLSVLELSLNHFYSVMPGWIFSLSKLVSLQLIQNEFLGPFPNGSWSLTSLTSFDASSNNLNTSIPNSLYGITTLENLNLNENNLGGVISSAVGNLTSLVSLSLSDNDLEGKIPTTIGNLCNLEEITLVTNNFSGEISETFESLLSGGCLSNSLESLYLGDNFFTGQISDQIGELNNLAYLSLTGNMISGPIPLSLGKLSLLVSLDLSNNKLNGSLPKSLGFLSNLQVLDISGNLLEGTISEVHFANLSRLSELHGSRNSLSLRVSPQWNPPFRLVQLRLRSWNLGPKFPTWLKSQKRFSVLDLSNTGISDSIPNWFWNLSFDFLNMNLSNNQIHGEISRKLNVTGRSAIYLGSNNLKGPLPQISSALRVLDLSNNFFSGDISRLLCKPLEGERISLTILRLGRNLLSGKISDCWTYWQSLQMIELGSNNLTGEIPSSIGLLSRLQSLHLRSNSLYGEIPLSLRNCSMLKVIDFGLNMISGNIPKWIGKDLPNLVVLSLRSNKLTSQIPDELCGLTELQILDVADNNLSGTIPSCFGNLSAMATRPQQEDPIFTNPFSFAEFLENAFVVTRGREDQYNTILPLLTSLDLSQNNLSGEIPQQLTSLQGLMSLNLSRNNLRGIIPDKIGDMTWIQSLDLSRNQMYGRIPPSMSNLHFLSHLNVSYNNLSGEIPESTQLQSIEASSFVGNQFLCGLPLLKKCREDDNEMTPENAEDGEKGGDNEDYWFRIGIAMGFGVGFAGVIAPLLLCGFWRRAYFWFFQEYIWYKILDCFIKFKYMMGISTPTHLA